MCAGVRAVGTRTVVTIHVAGYQAEYHAHETFRDMFNEQFD